MNVLSLFDGCACTRVALDRLGITPDNYYASEVDRYAIEVARNNWGDVEHIGDVRNVNADRLPQIDLLVGGSPCQDLSLASHDRRGLEGERSGLFYQYLRILRECSPRWFLLENVRMSQANQDTITDLLGVEPIEIDSALLSAQTRKRLYWTNLPVSQPDDAGLCMADILEDGWSDRDKSHCVDANYWKGGNWKTYTQKSRRQLVFGRVGRRVEVDPDDAFLRRVYDAQPTDSQVPPEDIHYRKLMPLECERLQTLPDNYTQFVSNTQRYKMIGNGFTVDVIAHILKGIVS